MQTYSKTFTGAGTWQINITGSYFALIASTLVANVRFYLGGAKLDLGDVQGILAGLEVLPKKVNSLGFAFDRVEIDASGADTITVGIGNGDARYNRGAASVTVTNVPHVIVDSGSIAIPARQIQPFYSDYNNSYKSVTAMGAGGVDNIFSAAGNANGAILRMGKVLSYQLGVPQCGFVAKNGSYATTIIDGDIILQGESVAYNTTYNIVGGGFEKEIYIPAGRSLAFVTTNAESYAQRSLLYTLL